MPDGQYRRSTGLECVDLILHTTSTIKTWVRYPAVVSLGRARGEMDSDEFDKSEERWELTRSPNACTPDGKAR